ncbi:MAG TPA: hypothetical protein VI997_02590, partial [Candidatus Thermoplasmatota archaeon]|nr:hypothetical protein [Candidatus Thermoplasmatota archaeon]
TPATGSGLVLAGDDTWTVPPLDAGGDAVLRVPLRTPSSAGPHALVATLRYTDAAGARVDAEHLLAFQVSGTTRGPLEVGLATASVAAGENATLAFSLRNAGPTAIDHLQLTIVAPAAGATIVAAADGGRLAAPARLEAGAVAKATASVRTALVATDFVALQVRAAYIAGGARDDVFDFAIPVESPVRLRLLSLEASEDELSGILVNTGTGTAYNPQISQGGSAPVLIEDLEPNEPASFRVPVAGAAPGPTTLDVAWNDERGGLHAATVAGDARAIRGAQTSDTPSAAWPLAAAGVALAALVRRRGG